MIAFIEPCANRSQVFVFAAFSSSQFPHVAAARLDCERPLTTAARSMAAFSFSEIRTVNTADMALSSDRLGIILFHD
jgi:hypothetical protein